MSHEIKDLYEFGSYRLNVANRVLLQHGEVVPLAPKTFDLLLLLVRSEGRLLGKQELINNLWPDTFVEDANLTFQIATLRKALGRDAAQWIETVPKHGYRFAATITRPAIVVHHHDPSPPPENLRRPPKKRLYVAVAVVLTIAIAFSARIATKTLVLPSPAGLSGKAAAVPLTAYPGWQGAPTLAPDGSQVAFSWNGPGEENYDIYVKLVGPGEPVRLTTDPAADLSPAWSPDGGRIAFLRFSADFLAGRAQLIVIPALGGGTELRIADVVPVGPMWFGNGRSVLAWTPDGQWIAFGGKFSENDLPGIWLVSVGTGEKHRLTTGYGGDVGDEVPAFSPDGLSLAFVRGRSLSTHEVFVLRLTAKGAPAGEPRQITTLNRPVAGLAWTP